MEGTSTSTLHLSSVRQAAKRRTSLVVADLGAGFIVPHSTATVILTRGMGPPVRLHPDPELSPSARLSAALIEMGVSDARGVTVFLPLSAALPDRAADAWCEALLTLGASPVVVARPIAAAAAMGLTMPGRSHLMIENGEVMVEASLVVDGTVSLCRTIDTAHGGWRTIVHALHEMLVALDPDDELDVRDTGIHVFGDGLPELSYLAELSGLAVSRPVGDWSSVVVGARRIARQMMAG